jgi:hypothetical protein
MVQQVSQDDFDCSVCEYFITQQVSFRAADSSEFKHLFQTSYLKPRSSKTIRKQVYEQYIPQMQGKITDIVKVFGFYFLFIFFLTVSVFLLLEYTWQTVNRNGRNDKKLLNSENKLFFL